MDKNATCLRKLTIIAPFFLAIIFYFLNKKIKKEQKRSLKKKIKKVKKKSDKHFFFIFWNCPLHGGCRLHPQRPQCVCDEDEQKTPLKVHPPNAGQGTLILFYSIDCGRLRFLADFWLQKSNDNINTFLTSY